MGYTDSLNALKRDIENGYLTVKVEDGTVTFSGSTFAHKDFLKREHRGTDLHFDRESKTWQMSVVSMYDGDKALVLEYAGIDVDAKPEVTEGEQELADLFGIDAEQLREEQGDRHADYAELVEGMRKAVEEMGEAHADEEVEYEFCVERGSTESGEVAQYHKVFEGTPDEVYHYWVRNTSRNSMALEWAVERDCSGKGRYFRWWVEYMCEVVCYRLGDDGEREWLDSRVVDIARLGGTHDDVNEGREPRTEAQRAANERYKAANSTQVKLRFYAKDSDVAEHLQAQPNKVAYIARLVREDMERNRD